MSKTPLKTAEEILDSAIADHASKMPLEDSVYRRMVTSNVSYLMVNKSIALAAMHQYHSQSQGLRWVKASERLPEIGSEVIVRANGSKYVARVYDESKVTDVPKISLFFNARHHFEYEHSSIEWLDESPLPSTKGEDANK